LGLSRRDLIAVFGAAVTAPVTGHVVLYACSANTRRWWDLETTRRMLNVALNDDSERLLHDRHVGSLTPPAPRYALPWGERLAALAPAPGRSFLVALGQSGFLIRTSASSTAIDPFLTDWPDRLQPSLLAAEDLAVDHILITHTHRDHLDAAALPIIAARRPDTVFVGPPTVVTRLIELGVDAARIITLLPSQSIELRDITVTAVPARHKPTTPDAQGYVVRVDGATIYHTGDTEHDECLQTAIAKRPDVLLVPINGRKGNMGPEHAALLARHSDVGVVIPMHYGCLQPTADLLDRFTAELERLGTNARIAVMDPGTIAYVPFRS
jgi:L-ascorbate metabolism protein UlaG (beta-lactamase superfamily)